jgi:hypothetical protein
MNWHEVPLTEHVTEAAALVGEAEVVIEFTATARGWFRLSVFEDLRATDAQHRFFARAVEKEDAAIQALAAGPTPEDAATLTLREAGVSLRRAKSR